jgi:hypothetical protein
MSNHQEEFRATAMWKRFFLWSGIGRRLRSLLFRPFSTADDGSGADGAATVPAMPSAR